MQTLIIIIVLVVVVALAVTAYFAPKIRKQRMELRRMRMIERIQAGGMNRLVQDTPDETSGIADSAYRSGYIGAVKELHGLLVWAKANGAGIGVEENAIVLKYGTVRFASVSTADGVLRNWKPGAKKPVVVRHISDIEANLKAYKEIREYYVIENEDPLGN